MFSTWIPRFGFKGPRRSLGPRPTGLKLVLWCDIHKPSGAVAQLGERLICTQEAVGSIPISSTSCAGAGL